MGKNRGSHDKPNSVTGQPRGKVERAVVKAEEAVARKVFGKCTLFCGSTDCPAACPER